MSHGSTARPRYLIAHPGAELYGSDRVMLESVAALIESGAKVTVALPGSGPLVDELVAAGASVVLIPSLVLRKSLLHPRRWPALVALSLKGLGAAWRIIGAVQPDAVYVSTVTLPLWPIIASMRRVPVLVHLHEGEQGASPLVKRGMYAPVLLAHSVIVNSEFSRSVVREVYPKLAERTQVVYNGVAGPESVSPARVELDDRVRLAYVGRLSPRKGPDLIVEALALIPPGLRASLVLIGDVFPGYEWYAQELRTRIAELGLEDRVTMTGFVPHVWEILDESDIVVIPSRFDEPFGNTAVEGVLASRVVLVSDTSGLREATEGFATARRFRPDDAAAIAEAVTDAVRDWPELRSSLTPAADAASERFSPHRYRGDVSAIMSALTLRSRSVKAPG